MVATAASRALPAMDAWKNEWHRRRSDSFDRLRPVRYH